jgi:hypothetical protein
MTASSLSKTRRAVSSWLALIALTGVALGCADRASSSTPPARGADASSMEPTKTKANASAPIPCHTDQDCPRLSCGPCTPGTILTAELRDRPVQCFRNPCVNASAVCGPEQVCVVGPGTEKDPAVFRAPARDR